MRKKLSDIAVKILREKIFRTRLDYTPEDYKNSVFIPDGDFKSAAEELVEHNYFERVKEESVEGYILTERAFLEG